MPRISNLVKLTLRTRIYLSMLAIILVSFVVTGGIAIYDHYEQSAEYHEQRLLRKEHAVRVNMEYFLKQQGGTIPTDSVQHLFHDKIEELADVHNVLITMYDLRGNLLLSNDTLAMDSLEVPHSINYSVLKQLSTGNNRVVLSTKNHEDISLVFWYFNDEGKKPIAITNVAYQRSSNEEKDLWAFLTELGQSYILLFLLASLIAYLLARYITRSLAAIGDRMKMVKFGKKNEPLEWQSQDEIGTLVSEYNRMILALDESAEKLARTERESAWREMAKQVAHEIKNPLTPMKLRVQYLQRAWEDGAPDFNEKLAAFTRSMSEQIETLSHIAGEFSRFAQMPKPELVRLNLMEITRDVVEMFSAGDKAEIVLRDYSTNSDRVLADRDQTRRAVVNLITNALQSLPEGHNGKIDVAIRDTRKGVLLRVQDNGCGIPDEMKHKIFVPNFTTKSTGTGLGLAMVHNMMKQSGGGVFFRSAEGKGTSFYLCFQTE
ncbi:MAG: HAMP domain-containing histidine kinase [Flavobacteriales bacterium]|nr:HAMP domain-containing histidine kinase [Flavobacteriales bacterium]